MSSVEKSKEKNKTEKVEKTEKPMFVTPENVDTTQAIRDNFKPINLFDTLLKDEQFQKSVSISADAIKASPELRAFQNGYNIAQQKIEINKHFIAEMEALGKPDARIEPDRYNRYQAYFTEMKRWEDEQTHIKQAIAQKIIMNKLII